MIILWLLYAFLGLKS